jgi:hypothetical protein
MLAARAGPQHWAADVARCRFGIQDCIERSNLRSASPERALHVNMWDTAIAVRQHGHTHISHLCSKSPRRSQPRLASLVPPPDAFLIRAQQRMLVRTQRPPASSPCGVLMNTGSYPNLS